MPNLVSGEYDVVLNGLNIHYSIRGKGSVLIAHSGGPGADARDCRRGDPPTLQPILAGRTGTLTDDQHGLCIDEAATLYNHACRAAAIAD